MSDKQYKVRASHCDHQTSDEEIYQVLKRTTEPLERSWEKLAKARRIALKFNMIKPPERVEYFAGRRRELVDDAVARAVLRLLRERPTAELVAVDTYPYGNGYVTPDESGVERCRSEPSGQPSRSQWRQEGQCPLAQGRRSRGGGKGAL
jgi:hypothetical protein